MTDNDKAEQDLKALFGAVADLGKAIFQAEAEVVTALLAKVTPPKVTVNVKVTHGKDK